MQNSPAAQKIELPECASRWIRVGTGNGNVFVPQRYAVEVLCTTSRSFVFGRVRMRSVKEMATGNVETETDGGGDG